MTRGRKILLIKIIGLLLSGLINAYCEILVRRIEKKPYDI